MSPTPRHSAPSPALTDHTDLPVSFNPDGPSTSKNFLQHLPNVVSSELPGVEEIDKDTEVTDLTHDYGSSISSMMDPVEESYFSDKYRLLAYGSETNEDDSDENAPWPTKAAKDNEDLDDAKEDIMDTCQTSKEDKGTDNPTFEYCDEYKNKLKNENLDHLDTSGSSDTCTDEEQIKKAKVDLDNSESSEKSMNTEL